MADQVTTSLAEAKVLVMQGLKGDTGYSPQIEVLDITGGHQVRITYKADQTHIQTDVFNVMDGAPGQPGAPGASGLNGADGFSPTVEVQDIVQSLPGGGTEVIGHKVIITDANGPHIFNVMDGEDGEGGGGGAAEAVLYIAQSLTAAQKAQARTNIDAGTYSKPSGGIPKTDLASDVQEVLDGAITTDNFGIYLDSEGKVVFLLSVSGTTVTLDTSFIYVYHAYASSRDAVFVIQIGGTADAPDVLSLRPTRFNATAGSITLIGEHNGNRYSVTLSAASVSTSPMTGTLVVEPIVTESDIPTAVSELTNDSGFQTAAQVQSAIAAIPDELPAVTSSDNGKFLRVVNGAWAAATVPPAESNSFGGGS